MYPDHPIERLQKCPPFLAHALARQRKKRVPLIEIVKRSGLSERTYLRTARMNSWGSVKLDVILGFLKGCEVDPWRMRKHYRFLRDHNYVIPYLTKRQRQIFDEICRGQESKNA